MATYMILHGSRTCKLVCNALFARNKFQLIDEKICRAFSSKKNDPFESPVVDQKKKIYLPQITLVQGNNVKTVMTLEAAEKLAKRREMQLIKVSDIDAHTKRPIYKLLSNSQYLHSETNVRDEKKENTKVAFKSEKLITLSRNIAEYDLQVKIKNINKLLNKFHTVKVLVSGDSENVGKLTEALEFSTKDNGTVFKKIQKSSTTVYVLHPLLPKSETEDPVSSETLASDIR